MWYFNKTLLISTKIIGFLKNKSKLEIRNWIEIRNSKLKIKQK